jgi:hypothetical protein
MENQLSLVFRILFGIALLCAGLAIAERVAFAAGYTLLRGASSGGRLLEIAAILTIFVIALLLRQIRDLLRAGRG